MAVGTHHVDISGEAEYLQNCQLKHDEEAKKKNVHIVGESKGASGGISVQWDPPFCYFEAGAHPIYQ